MMKLLTPVFLSFVVPAVVAAGETRLPLDTPNGLTLHHTVATPVTFNGKPCLKLTSSTAEPVAASGTPQRKGAAAVTETGRVDHLALVDGSEFHNGTLEVDIAGAPGPGAPGAARGFVGIAFRVQPDRRTYDCFYLRPTNGRAEDQERRNHSAQYISHPQHTWYSLREKTPSRYEAYVDIVPEKWIHMKVEVDGTKARLFVNGADQPTLIVNDVKTGAEASGGVALWFEGSTVAHFANLRITPR